MLMRVFVIVPRWKFWFANKRIFYFLYDFLSYWKCIPSFVKKLSEKHKNEIKIQNQKIFFFQLVGLKSSSEKENIYPSCFFEKNFNKNKQKYSKNVFVI